MSNIREGELMNVKHGRPPVLMPGFDFGSITDKINGIVFAPRAPLAWWMVFLPAAAMAGILGFAATYLFYKGVGIWGINIPVGWGFAIVNFVWWIGIGHAGTLISAILLLLKQTWRNSINRFAEAMTLFAVMCAGMFPVFHLGRPWLAYWLFPYPNTMTVWPNFRSPLVWDVFAVSTYFTISLLFWYAGLIPDLATLRDSADNRLVKMAYGIAALGWRGSARHWKRYESAYLFLAGLATPLVLSVHTVVSFDFAVAIVPGWHATIFPPYFVAGAVFSGFAMVLILAIPVRKAYGLEDVITMRHLDNCAKVMLATGLIVAYGYFAEFFFSWYGTNPYEKYVTWNRMHGPYGAVYWLLMLC
ncbi:MAG: NrfD/PsrC family molybdoenzyme membrane anchor subunit, partial [Terriglobales bacterium]